MLKCIKLKETKQLKVVTYHRMGSSKAMVASHSDKRPLLSPSLFNHQPVISCGLVFTQREEVHPRMAKELPADNLVLLEQLLTSQACWSKK